MLWSQSYLLFGQGLGVSFLIAALPILTLLTMLAGLRRPAWQAGLAGLAVTFALAIGGYRMPALTALSAAANGAAFGLFPILWLIFWAITLFRVTVATGHFEIIKDSIGRLTPDPRLQALLIAFAFSGFLEGTAGFGTPVAIAATMLIGLGFSPFAASAICLLANTAPVAFGSIGIPIFTLAGTTGLSPYKLSAAVGALCAPITLIVPAYLILAMGGFAATEGIWLPLVVAGLVSGSVQFAVSTWLGPPLTDILAGISCMAALVLLFRYQRLRPARPSRTPWTAGRHTAYRDMLFRFALQQEIELTGECAMQVRVMPAVASRALLLAWSPYVLLIGFVMLWGYAPFAALLDRATIVIHWPYLHNVVQKMPPIVKAPTPYAANFAFNWLSAAGTACMLATCLSTLLLGMRPSSFLAVIRGTARQLAKPAGTIATVLAMAFLMNYSGATVTLGLAFAATGTLFPLFSALLGWLGVFLTGSDTSANALFGNLQVVTAQHLGLNPVLMAAANSSGGVMGKMISLQTIAIAAAATGLSTADQARLFRFTLKHSILLASLIGALTLFYTHVLHL